MSISVLLYNDLFSPKRSVNSILLNSNISVFRIYKIQQWVCLFWQFFRNTHVEIDEKIVQIHANKHTNCSTEQLQMQCKFYSFKLLFQIKICINKQDI